MNSRPLPEISRRGFLRGGGCAVAGAALLAPTLQWTESSAQAATPRRLRVAAITSECSYRSHAHVILENFLDPYLFNGRMITPDTEVVSLYVDQVPAGDLSRAISAKYRIPIHNTIAVIVNIECSVGKVTSYHSTNTKK